MGKERFVTFSVATSVAASQGADPENTSMIEAAISATLPAVGQTVDLDKINAQLRAAPKTGQLAAGHRR